MNDHNSSFRWTLKRFLQLQTKPRFPYDSYLFKLSSGHRQAMLNIFIFTCCYVYMKYFETWSSQPGSVLNVLYSQCVYSPWSCELHALVAVEEPSLNTCTAANTYRELACWRGLCTGTTNAEATPFCSFLNTQEMNFFQQNKTFLKDNLMLCLCHWRVTGPLVTFIANHCYITP